MTFFQQFNFDTLLAIISCITGIAALFVGGKAYKNSKLNKNTIKSKKEFDKGAIDNSITVGGDYHCDGLSEKGLINVMEKMNEMTSYSFSSALNYAYSMFQEKCNENLRQIINETQKIVSKQKLNIAGYTKIDWINIYFESAKNTSDTYMQGIWAKVLAKELSVPNSFNYKTLDTLKNMSEIEFRLFEKLSETNVNSAIIKGDYLNNYGLTWINLQKLREYGLISLDDSERTITVEYNKISSQTINNQFLVIFKNNKSNNQPIKNRIQCYLLTSVAQELLSIVSNTTSEGLAKDIALNMKKEVATDCIVELHRINFVYNNGLSFNYQLQDILQITPNGDASETDP